MSSYRTDRALLLEQDPQILSENLQIASIKDADWRHQKAAMVGGYNSVAEMAVDELIGMVREQLAMIHSLEERIVALEGDIAELNR